MVVVDASCLKQADSEPKSVGLVWGSAAAWCCSTFTRWTERTLAMTSVWWQHYKYRHGYYYYYYHGMSTQEINPITPTIDRRPNQDLNPSPSIVQASTVLIQLQRWTLLTEGLSLEFPNTCLCRIQLFLYLPVFWWDLNSHNLSAIRNNQQRT